ncbi:hypothetical protein BDB00DRAFT_384767 [Zychaea mexicana]|uniref:uncharacterized protein n=1 Tax=Zychaea mexicana TaxID=64656 RepID=UPI0022FE7827|nr:uncharacterized protein BDB00DRAFT_384767 [Zychaea mexicana]KAI9493099.1 hypothetical protein BDB00DRAFT_384767 [Zychaea mexicana]
MNILPHKSWNVYNKKNIEKVRRDEAKAREEEQLKAERAAQAESEARLDLLRKRALKKQEHVRSTSNSSLVPQPSTAPQHINLFEEEAKEHAENEEHLAEQKAKEDQWERQVTMYLDKDVNKESTPWYAIKEYDRYGNSSKDSKKGKHDNLKDERRRRRKRKRDPIKINEDPLVEIRSSLSKREEKRKERYSRIMKKDKKEKSSMKSTSASPSIEALRAQRLERERKERARTKSYIYGEVQDVKPPVEEERYSSQFNPTDTAEARKSRLHRRQPYR